MKKILVLIILIFFISCNKSQEQVKEIVEKTLSNNLVNKEENTVKKRFSPPNNYAWIEEKPNSYEEFLLNFPLENYGAKILDYTGNPIANQNLHEAVYKVDVGNKDLQQCADSIFRLYAEFLWKQNRKDEIAFHFTSGHLVKWSDYKNGIRPIIKGNSVKFSKLAKADDSYQNFRKYLDLIYNYSGTISLFKETKPVAKTENLKTGDILITPGSPGHVVFIAGVCENKDGKKLFLLSEGFTPAQSIHLLKNPTNITFSPWYELDASSMSVLTARFIFSPVNFRSLE